ncbi:MAG: ABC transporter ATP-binding protein [Sphaerochaetaceae bacterium]|jgi:NitT/TauT family transport system ATP-binding protein
MKVPKIEYDNVTKIFSTRRQKITAVQDFSIAIEDGQFVSIVGPSGCGKSTVIRLLNGIIPPTSGEIKIDGVPHGKKKLSKERLKKMGFVFQEPNLLPWLTIKENVALPLKVFHMKESEDWERVDELLNMVGLYETKDAYPTEVSGGMTQRAGVIRAMVHNPEILLMDEPFGSLDGITQDALDMEILKVWEKTKKTIIFITHNIDEAVLLSEKIFVMATQPGRLISIQDVHLPYPRELEMKETHEFIDFSNMITNLLGELELSIIK